MDEKRRFIGIEVPQDTHEWLTRRAGAMTANYGRRVTTSDIVRDAIDAYRARSEAMSIKWPLVDAEEVEEEPTHV